MADAGEHYPKPKYVVNQATTVLQHKRVANKVVHMPREKPGNIIIIHGVNDVGTSFGDVEAGLCAGLEKRLFRHFTPATYRVPTVADKDKVEDDPDAVYFKRQAVSDTDSPVIPFYWGYREVKDEAKTVNGQKTDRYGNRLDKDLSKGGGPFGNATSSLPDMWNRGVCAPVDPVADPLRPIKAAPGRLYMVLAAQRLAALIAMIRQYEKKDTVTIVAHSQGCLLSLLAQAMLMERGERTADTLILTHPPYSLDEEVSLTMKALTYFDGGKDAAMERHYEMISGRQSMHARLQTLVNIVQGVAKARAAEPAFSAIDEAKCGGMVEGRWKPEADRDNRGKVYLYFSPEDMTVALDNMRGIGWQGVPDYIHGTESTYKPDQANIAYAYSLRSVEHHRWSPGTVTRMPLKELGASFHQRVFTNKLRLDPGTQKTQEVLVGQLQHDFALRIKGEDDHAHVEASGRSLRASLPAATWPIYHGDTPEEQRYGIRTINGEPLHPPCKADLRGNQIDADKLPDSSSHAKLAPADKGPCEEVDPITAAIAVTSGAGLKVSQEEVPDPAGHLGYPSTPQELPKQELGRMTAAYNKQRNPNSEKPDDKFNIVRAIRYPTGKVVAMVQESPNAARLRWQHELGAKSFHSAIFDSRENHRQVTAYDVAIGSGKASTDPNFYAYLCAVADWRLKKPTKRDSVRRGILMWDDFLVDFGAYYKCEPEWRRQLIGGNCHYYSTGRLPAGLPLLSGKLWDIVVSETTAGKRVNQPATGKAQS